MIWGLLVGLTIGMIMTIFFEKGYNLIVKKRNKELIVRIGKYHLHHSLYGVGLVTLYLFIQNIILLGAAIGVIIEHTIFDKKFTFIDVT